MYIYVCVCVCVWSWAEVCHLSTFEALETILVNLSTNMTKNQDAYQETWKDLNKII